MIYVTYFYKDTFLTEKKWNKQNSSLCFAQNGYFKYHSPNSAVIVALCWWVARLLFWGSYVLIDVYLGKFSFCDQ